MRANPSIRIAFLALLAACSTPPVDDVTWRCTTEADCGDGYVCERTDGLCRPADGEGRNGIFDDRILLGALLPLSRGPAEAALAWQQGLEAAFGHINARGGVHGRTLALDIRDDAHDPETALAVLPALTGRRQVLAVLGGFGNHVAEVVGTTLEERGVPFIGRAGDAGLRQVPARRYLFAISAGDAAEVGALVSELIADDVHLSNIAVVVQAAPNGEAPDAQGRSVLAGLAAAGVQQPGVGLVPAGTTDVEAAVLALHAWQQAPERVAAAGSVRTAVLLTTDATASAHFVRAFDQRLAEEPASRVTPRYLATGAPGATALAAAFRRLDAPLEPPCGGGLRIALGVPSWLAETPVARAYRVELEAADPLAQAGDVSFEGYLTGRLIAAALEAQGPEITGESFVDTLQETRVDHAGGFTPDRHHAIRAVALATLTPSCTLELD